MIELYQQTIRNTISCFGKGLHSGQSVSVTFKPAPEDTGIVFVRTDLSDSSAIVEAKYNNVAGTTLGTSVYNSAKVGVSTIEHLTAALFGLNIDNIIIEINGPEIPIMDGSSADFVFLLQCAGIEKQNKVKKFNKILQSVKVEKDGSYIEIVPSDKFEINLEINFPTPVIGRQQLTFHPNNNNFIKHIANARTFGFLSDVEKLHSAGLAKGASLNNAIVINQEHEVMNQDGLRYQDEFVRHKILDCIGDLYLGGLIQGTINAYCSGHYLNNKLLHSVFETQHNWCRIEPNTALI